MAATRAAILQKRYELLERIGSGGMAQVWRAHDNRLRRDVAVKIVFDGEDASRARRIVREAKAMAALAHPNILAVYDYGEDEEGRPFIVTEYIDGGDLHKVLAERGSLPPEEVREIMRGVLLGVEVAHRNGIVHGDIKPANVLMAPDGPRVGDFGVARILDEDTGNTTVAATPRFAAPEVLKGERATPAADIYSAACLAFQLLTGRAPYEGNNAWEIAAKHIGSPVPRVGEFVDVPPDLDEAIHRGMAKKPERRFASAAEFAQAIAPPAATTMPIGAATAPPPDRTERIGASGAELDKVAIFGPLWPLVKGVRDGVRELVERPNLAGVAILCLFLVIVGLLGFHGSPSTATEVPDVRGESVPEAVAALQKAGLQPEVSYTPIASGTAGIVSETIPVAGTALRNGSRVQVIATALAVTPAPSVVEDVGGPSSAPVAPVRRAHRHKR
jgi:serine/threonine-protein kinase